MHWEEVLQIRREFGKRIRKLRKAQKMGLRKFGLMIGMNKNSISKIERGLVSPTLDSILKISEGLGVTLEELVYGLEKQEHLEMADASIRRGANKALGSMGKSSNDSTSYHSTKL